FAHRRNDLTTVGKIARAPFRPRMMEQAILPTYFRCFRKQKLVCSAGMLLSSVEAWSFFVIYRPPPEIPGKQYPLVRSDKIGASTERYSIPLLRPCRSSPPFR